MVAKDPVAPVTCCPPAVLIVQQTDVLLASMVCLSTLMMIISANTALSCSKVVENAILICARLAKNPRGF